MILGGEAFGRCQVTNGINGLIKEAPENSPASATMWGCDEESTTQQIALTQPPWSQTSTVQSSEKEMSVFVYKHPVCGLLLAQPKWNKTSSIFETYVPGQSCATFFPSSSVSSSISAPALPNPSFSNPLLYCPESGLHSYPLTRRSPQSITPKLWREGSLPISDRRVGRFSNARKTSCMFIPSWRWENLVPSHPQPPSLFHAAVSSLAVTPFNCPNLTASLLVCPLLSTVRSQRLRSKSALFPVGLWATAHGCMAETEPSAAPCQLCNPHGPASTQRQEYFCLIQIKPSHTAVRAATTQRGHNLLIVQRCHRIGR